MRSVCRLTEVVILSTGLLFPGATAFAQVPAERPETDPEGTAAFEGQVVDGGTIKVVLHDRDVTLETPYGRLTVPATQIERIDLAARVTAEEAKRIDQAVGNLGDSEFQVREDASAELLGLGPKAYSALMEARRTADPEVVRRARQLLEQIRNQVPSDRWPVLRYDVVQTADSIFSGRVTTDPLDVTTAAFARQPLHLAKLSSLRAPMASDRNQQDNVPTFVIGVGHALPEPPFSTDFERETPKERSPVDVQFADGSTLKLLLLEETIALTTAYGTLRIPMGDVLELRPGPRKPAESPAGRGTGDVGRRQSVEWDIVLTAHSRMAGEIETEAFAVRTFQFGDQKLKLADVASIRSSPAPNAEPANVLPDPGSLTSFHDRAGQTLFFKVTGAVGSTIWGTGVYTSDSALATAAVHAGVLKPGQTGTVRVKIVPSPPSFAGSTRNGVSSNNYGPFSGAYQVLK